MILYQNKYLLLLLVLLLFSCENNNKYNTFEKHNSGCPNRQIEIELEVSKKEIKKRDSFDLTIKVKNCSEKKVALMKFALTDNPFLYFYENGKIIRPELTNTLPLYSGEQDINSFYFINPKEEVIITHKIYSRYRKIYFITKGDFYSGQYLYIPDGDYYIPIDNNTKDIALRFIYKSLDSEKKYAEILGISDFISQEDIQSNEVILKLK